MCKKMENVLQLNQVEFSPLIMDDATILLGSQFVLIIYKYFSDSYILTMM